MSEAGERRAFRTAALLIVDFVLRHVPARARLGREKLRVSRGTFHTKRGENASPCRDLLTSSLGLARPGRSIAMPEQGFGTKLACKARELRGRLSRNAQAPIPRRIGPTMQIRPLLAHPNSRSAQVEIQDRHLSSSSIKCGQAAGSLDVFVLLHRASDGPPPSDAPQRRMPRRCAMTAWLSSQLGRNHLRLRWSAPERPGHVSRRSSAAK